MTTQSARDYAHDVIKNLKDELGDECDYMSALDYFDGVLDVRRTFNNDGEMILVSLLVTYGAPNCWLDVYASGTVVARASWYSDEQIVSAYDLDEFAEIVFEIFAAKMERTSA